MGEIWFTISPDHPLLVKFLFTSDNLSIQVHPGDRPGSRGKTEMWHVLRAEDGAQVGIGLKRQSSAAELDKVEELLEWMPAKVGDTFFIPAGTIHALGAGLVICEIQQNSDTTYRLYDFGRNRELHLEEGGKVADFAPSQPRRPLPVECEHFNTELFQKDARLDRERIAVAIEGPDAGVAWALEAGEEFDCGSSKYLLVC